LKWRFLKWGFFSVAFFLPHFKLDRRFSESAIQFLNENFKYQYFLLKIGSPIKIVGDPIFRQKFQILIFSIKIKLPIQNIGNPIFK